MSTPFTLVVFPVSRAGDWEWIAGTGSPELSASGDEPATHQWFSIRPTSSEEAEIDDTLVGADTKLAVDLETESPTAVIEAATGLKHITEDDE